MRIAQLEVLRMRLKSGEYDGVHPMQAWLDIDELILWKKLHGDKTISKHDLEVKGEEEE